MPPTEQLETIGGRYRLGERIGRGGMGEVFVAHDLRLDREVAIKLIRADLADHDGMRDRVLAEARLAARLSHPHVVSVFDTGEVEGRAYVVMERLSGRTLQDEMGGGPMAPGRVRDIGLQVLRAIGAAHALGIVHRDVKPGNVLDAGVGTWKVADFGIAKWLHADETLTGTGELLGSPSYLAPERVEGREAGPASDLYAVGVLLYEAVCARKPFVGDDPIALATAIHEGRYPPPREVRPDADEQIVAVIERAMRLDPAERYADADEMAEALSGESATADADADATARIGEPTTVPATETVQLPPLEETARLPVEAGVVDAPAPEAPARPAEAHPVEAQAEPATSEEAPRPSRPRRRAVIEFAAIVIAVALVTTLAILAFTGRDRPVDRGPSSGLAPRLEESLERLEEAVRP